MKCPHCSVTISLEEDHEEFWGLDDDDGPLGAGHGVAYGSCPSCGHLIVLYVQGEYELGVAGNVRFNRKSNEIIFPKYSTRSVELEVPERFKKDFLEASAVLSISPKASAALSRRILQDILREHLKIKKKTLAHEIDEFIQREDIPSYLTDAVDAIRTIGNFAAHPLKDTNTGEVVEVEAGEAEWLLEVNESLFDFVFIQPKRLEHRRNKLNSKLKSLGKPQLKDSK